MRTETRRRASVTKAWPIREKTGMWPTFPYHVRNSTGFLGVATWPSLSEGIRGRRFLFDPTFALRTKPFWNVSSLRLIYHVRLAR